MSVLTSAAASTNRIMIMRTAISRIIVVDIMSGRAGFAQRAVVHACLVFRLGGIIGMFVM